MGSLPRKSPEQDGTSFNFDSASTSEIVQVALNLDLPHSGPNEGVDSEGGVL